MRKHIFLIGMLLVVLVFSGCQSKKRQAKLEADFQAVKAVYEQPEATAEDKAAAYQTFLDTWPKDQTYTPQVKEWLEQNTPPEGMVLIPAGNFKIGCVPGDGECDADERPAKDIFLDAFYLDLHEVTVAEYRACVDTGNCKAIELPKDEKEAAWYNWGAKDREDHPINGVSWNDASAYCGWRQKRLPTEAEFEKVLRGGKDRKKYPWGNAGDPPAKFGNYADTSAKREFKDWDWEILNYDDGFVSTAPVCSFAKNPYGLCDISGNVWEWCADWYDENWYGAMPEQNPFNETAAQYRVLRGGAWDYAVWNLRASNRVSGPPHGVYLVGGFRCARNTK